MQEKKSTGGRRRKNFNFTFTVDDSRQNDEGINCERILQHINVVNVAHRDNKEPLNYKVESEGSLNF